MGAGRSRQARFNHYYLFYATQALAEARDDESLRRAAEEMDRQRMRRAVAAYNADPATDEDLAEMLDLVERLLPAIHAALTRLLPKRVEILPPLAKRPSPHTGTTPKRPQSE